MALPVLDRLLTIVVTATVTSAVWIVAGGTIIDEARLPGGVMGGLAGAAKTSAGAAETGGPEIKTLSQTVPTLKNPDAIIIPVAGKSAGDLTDTFTDKRGGGSRLHEALDIMAPEGTPVLAAAPGRVEKLFYSKAGGNTVYVRSGDGQTIYYYAHLQRYAPDLAEGQTVAAGRRLGTVGYTGNASPDGPHLHFAILRTAPAAKWWEPATPVNPYPLLTAR